LKTIRLYVIKQTKAEHGRSDEADDGKGRDCCDVGYVREIRFWAVASEKFKKFQSFSIEIV